MQNRFTREPRPLPVTFRSLEELLSRLQGHPGAFCLESGLESGESNSWHFLGAYPCGEFIGIGAQWRASIEGVGTTSGEGSLLDALQRWLDQWSGHSTPTDVLSAEKNSSLPPFSGGAVGYFGFELGEEIDRYPINRATTPTEVTGLEEIPDIHLKLYDEIVAVEVATGEATAWIRGRSELSSRSWWDLTPQSTIQQCPPLRTVGSTIDDASYLERVDTIRGLIGEGEVYEVNLTRTHQLEGGPDPWELYRRLRRAQPVPFAALLPWEPAAVISASPERFLRVDGSRVETRPIKGTIPRGETPEEDRERGERLLEDPKERAELAMIVDLERNDLGRVCEAGSVRVLEEAQLEQYSTVIHTVATVEGQLRSGTSVTDLLRATFPGGSISGAPKLAALETIARLEPTPRKVYTGAFGWIGPDADLDLAIAIRTVTRCGDRTYFSVGGAVTWDSIPERELAELAAKGKAVFAALHGRSTCEDQTQRSEPQQDGTVAD